MFFLLKYILITVLQNIDQIIVPSGHTEIDRKKLEQIFNKTKKHSCQFLRYKTYLFSVQTPLTQNLI